jgi:hypothetical protein
VVVQDDQLPCRSRAGLEQAEPARASGVEGDHDLGPDRVAIRRAEEVDTGQELQDPGDLEWQVTEGRDDPRQSRAAARAQGVRHREHRPERVSVRPGMTGEADLGRAVQQLDRPRPLGLDVRRILA